MYEYIKKNIGGLESRIAEAAVKAGRARKEITLVAVAKTFGQEITRAAVDFGLTDIGESRIQEAIPKIKELGPICRWHMIGHVQTNKAARAVEFFDMIQSVDSLKLAEEINRRAGEIGKKIDCLVEINSSGEESKYGFTFDAALDAVKKIDKLEFICVRGLMTIGPWTSDKEQIRNAFRETKELFDRGRELTGQRFDTLSMGMSSDFEIAIEEGSTMIRVGTAIFGERPKK